MSQTPVAIDAQQRINCPLMQHLSHVDDPRHPKLRVHLLYDILVIIVLGMMCGAKSLVLVETWAREKEEFLRTFLRLPGGIPSHDTLSRVLSMLQPAQLRQCLVHWSEALRTKAGQGVIAIDGKTLRRTFDRAAQKSALHLVSAFCSAEQLVLGQIGSETKKNEVTAIKALLPLLDIRGSLVTMDAMGCQKSIAAQIRQQGGDFLLALKNNHKRCIVRWASALKSWPKDVSNRRFIRLVSRRIRVMPIRPMVALNNPPSRPWMSQAG